MAKSKMVPKGAFVMPVLPGNLKLDPLLAGLLHTMSFLEFSDDDTVDPDWAIEAMEHVGHYLQKLTTLQIQDVEAQLARVAAHARKKKLSQQFIEFVERFLENAGVGEDDSEE